MILYPFVVVSCFFAEYPFLQGFLDTVRVFFTTGQRDLDLERDLEEEEDTEEDLERDLDLDPDLDFERVLRTIFCGILV